MHLAALAPLGPVPAGVGAPLRGRLSRARVEDHRPRLRHPLSNRAQETARIVHDGLKDACSEPALGLRIDGGPRRQVVRHRPPWGAGAHDGAQAIEHLAQGVLPLWRLLGHEGHRGGDERPFVITAITRIRFSRHTGKAHSPHYSRDTTTGGRSTYTAPTEVPPLRLCSFNVAWAAVIVARRDVVRSA